MSNSLNPAAALAEAYALALQLKQSGDIPTAIEACRLILQANPQQVETLLLLGVCHWQQRQTDAALAVLDIALRVRPAWADAYFNRGLVLQAMGRPAEAVASYQAAITSNPRWAEAHYNKANALAELGRIPDALESFGEAVNINPQLAEAYFDMGHTLQGIGRFDAALSSYDKTISLRPDHHRALNNRGLVLLDMKLDILALDSFNRAITLKPDHAKAHNNRGNALLALGRVPEALQSYDQALSLEPAYPEACYNRGNALQELLRFDEAIASYGAATVLRADYAEAHWNEGLCRLLCGDFSGGWKKYEWRWKLPTNRRRDFSGAGRGPWTGKESLVGKTILLYAEQGLGDTLQFCRYAALVAELGARVLLEVQPGLRALLENLEGTSQVLAIGDDPPAFDFYCSLLSLPGIFGTDLASIPAKVPYVIVDEEKRRTWAQRLGRKSKRRVGLVWSGSPTHKRDHYRSIPLETLQPLLDIEGIEFISLQQDIRESDASYFKNSCIRDFGSDITDFSETAALAGLMDRNICVDTAVAHLMGAMSLPVWIMLPCLPDWRWLLERGDTPWYPSARLFRQNRREDWVSVVAKVAAELGAWRGDSTKSS